MSDAAPAPAAEPVTLDARPEGRYHSDQIVAHWTVVFLVIFQYLTGQGMERAHEVGLALGALPASGSIVVHAVIGLSILAAMLWRLGLRLKHGAPPPPDTEPKPLQWLSRSVHYAFYAILIAMPIAGALALWLGSATLGWLHGLSAWILLGLIALHIAGGLWHALKRDGVIRRIARGNVVP